MELLSQQTIVTFVSRTSLEMQINDLSQPVETDYRE